MNKTININRCCKKAAAVFALVFSLSSGFTSLAADVKVPQASGTLTYTNGNAVIDASHVSDGYVMMKYSSSKKIKVRVIKETTYTYDLNPSGQYETFPLSEGSGVYTFQILENVSGLSYSLVVNQAVPVNLSSSLSPFLYPNQFCNFNSNSAIVGVADTVTAGITDPLKKVEAVYNYAVDNFTYDYDKAKSVQSGYLPNVDNTLATKTGICFDYASVMASMLRLEGIPTRLVIGYAGEAYHAWVSVYIQGQGWIDSVIYFDGNNWTFMDPTFASTGKKSQSANTFVANPSNYKAKFTY